jgi:hypothetical protein
MKSTSELDVQYIRYLENGWKYQYYRVPVPTDFLRARPPRAGTGSCVRRSHASSILLCVMNVWELQREGTRRLIVFPLPTDRRLWAAACCLLHNEQNGKRLAARPGSACAWVRGHGRGRMDGWAGSRNRRTAAGGTARCEPPSRPCDQWTAPPPYGPLQTGGLVRRTVSVREHASSHSYRLVWGRLAWGGGGPR